MNISIEKILVPVFLLSLTMCGLMTFQTIEIINQKNALMEAEKQQEKPLDDVRKIQVQIDALALGTLKLAQQGNKNAQLIVSQLKDMGLVIKDPTATTQPTKTP